MEKTFTEKEVIDIISLVEAIKDGKKLETPNGKGGYVEVKDIIVNDLLQYFKKYRIKTKNIKTTIKEVREEINMMQNVNNVTQEPIITTTTGDWFAYKDSLSENIKSVIRSDMNEDEKVNVIIGLCCQRTNYIEYPWNLPQVTCCCNAQNTGSDLRK